MTTTGSAYGAQISWMEAEILATIALDLFRADRHEEARARTVENPVMEAKRAAALVALDGLARGGWTLAQADLGNGDYIIICEADGWTREVFESRYSRW
jgi:hypothetical protein